MTFRNLVHYLHGSHKKIEVMIIIIMIIIIINIITITRKMYFEKKNIVAFTCSNDVLKYKINGKRIIKSLKHDNIVFGSYISQNHSCITRLFLDPRRTFLLVA